MQTLNLMNHTDVRTFFDQQLCLAQQNCCKIMAKAWVKMIEPKKQSNFPYTRGDAGRPPWWPDTPVDVGRDGYVPHREPDHLHQWRTSGTHLILRRKILLHQSFLFGMILAG